MGWVLRLRGQKRVPLPPARMKGRNSRGGFKVGFIVNESGWCSGETTPKRRQFETRWIEVVRELPCDSRNYSGIARRISDGTVEMKLQSGLQAGTTASSPRRSGMGACPLDCSCPSPAPTNTSCTVFDFFPAGSEKFSVVRIFQTRAIDAKIFRLHHNFSASCERLRAADRLYFRGDRACFRLQANGLQAIFQMQFAGAAVIVQAIGHVGVLLRLQHHDAGKNRVNGAGVDKNHFVFLHRNRLQQVFERVIVNGGFHVGQAGSGAQAQRDGCARIGFQNVPAFCFPVRLAMLPRHFISGMNLHAQLLAGK